MINIQKIRDLLSEQKLSKVEVAEKCGLTNAGFHRILKSGKAKLETVQKLAMVLSVPVSALLQEDSNMVSEEPAHYAKDRRFDYNTEKLMQMQINFLQGQLTEKDKVIDYLMKELAILKGIK